jgi:hypothetical protein
MTKASKNTDVSGKKPEETAATDAAPAPQDAKRRPLTVLRVDDCSASIWARAFAVQGRPTTFFSVSLERSYKDRDGTWKYVKSFDPDSLGKVIALCQQASEAIRELQQQGGAAA